MIPPTRQLPPAPLHVELAEYGIRLAPELSGLRPNLSKFNLTKPFLRIIRIGDEIIYEPDKAHDFEGWGSFTVTLECPPDS